MTFLKIRKFRIMNIYISYVFFNMCFIYFLNFRFWKFIIWFSFFNLTFWKQNKIWNLRFWETTKMCCFCLKTKTRFQLLLIFIETERNTNIQNAKFSNFQQQHIWFSSNFQIFKISNWHFFHISPPPLTPDQLPQRPLCYPIYASSFNP